ncbi:MAG: hypothetical protein GY726_05515, partial [Proteobacteria bacterium]|nr:hypothetical protein [Pseudomonadota bacterium]
MTLVTEPLNASRADYVFVLCAGRFLFISYFVFLSWQLLTPVTIVSAGSWDKLIHFSGFFVLGGLAILAGRNIPASRLILMLIAYAALTEILQHFVPGRSFSVLDWVADSLGV